MKRKKPTGRRWVVERTALGEVLREHAVIHFMLSLDTLLRDLVVMLYLVERMFESQPEGSGTGKGHRLHVGLPLPAQ